MPIQIRATACVFALLLTGCVTTSERVHFQTLSDSPWGADQTKVPGLFFKPEGNGPFPAIVLLHTASGVHRHVSQDWPKVLTENGYAVLTVDSYTPRNVTDSREKLLAQARDAYGALDYLASRSDVDGARIGVMGFSHGAIAIVEHTMRAKPRAPGDRNYKAAASVYGRCNGLGAEDRDYIPLLIIAAEHDVRLKDTCIQPMEKFGFEGTILKGAHHAFDVESRVTVDPFGNQMRYSRAATQEAHALSLAFFAKHLKR